MELFAADVAADSFAWLCGSFLKHAPLGHRGHELLTGLSQPGHLIQSEERDPVNEVEGALLPDGAIEGALTGGAAVEGGDLMGFVDAFCTELCGDICC